MYEVFHRRGAEPRGDMDSFSLLQDANKLKESISPANSVFLR